MSLSDHIARWEPLFRGEPWWEMHCVLYEGPGHDWEGASEAMELMVYQLAQARGFATIQKCPECSAIVDEPSTLCSWHPCQRCREQDAWREEAHRLMRAEAKIAYDYRRSRMTPEERELEDREAQEQYRSYLHGVIARDVQ